MLEDSLPIILVSASDVTSAEEIISEVVGEERGEGAGEGVVWEVRTRYYSAALRLLPRPDSPVTPPPGQVHAHLIYVAPHELPHSVQVVRRRAGEVGETEGPRLVGVRAGEAPPGLQAAAALLRYELVLLQPPPPPPLGAHDEDADVRGPARLRAALHAHQWHNLRLLPPPTLGNGGGDVGVASESAEEREAACMAEAFGAVLSILAGRPPPAAPRHLRLAAADRLAAALCRALPDLHDDLLHHTDLPDLHDDLLHHPDLHDDLLHHTDDEDLPAPRHSPPS